MKLTLTSDRDVIGSVVQDLLVNRRGQLESDWVGADNDHSGDPQVESGLVTNSNTFCSLFAIKDPCERGFFTDLVCVRFFRFLQERHTLYLW